MVWELILGAIAGGTALAMDASRQKSTDPETGQYDTSLDPSDPMFGLSREQREALPAHIRESMYAPYGGAPDAPLHSMDQMAAAAQDRRIDPQLEAMLRAQAQGAAPSAAEIMMQAGMDRTARQSMSLAASDPSVNAALANRTAQQQMGQQNLQGMQSMAALRAQEQAGAQQRLGQFLQQQQAFNDQMTAMYMSQGFNRAQAELMARQHQAQLQVGISQGNVQAGLQERGQNMQMAGAVVGAVGQGAGSAATTGGGAAGGGGGAAAGGGAGAAGGAPVA